MAVGSITWDIAGAALTPAERWSAARQVNSGFVSEYGVVLLIGLALLVLIVLLWWVSSWHHSRDPEAQEERFGQNAIQRGLSVRERQILLAVALRAGLRQSDKIFASSAAFDKGAKKLLAEFARTRTPGENERLTGEVTSLRAKLGFAPAARRGEPVRRAEPSSRSIPVGKAVELLPRGRQEESTVEGTVVRNDDIELAVELGSAVEDGGGTSWRVRYCFGMSIWEFETAAIRCEGTRLTLNHSERIRFVNRRRFPRTPANRRALVALFPFVRSIASGAGLPATGPGPVGLLGEGNCCPLAVPEFVEGVVTEVAGPGLRLRSSLRVRKGERVLVLFGVTDGAAATGEQNDGGRPPCMIEHVGYVRHSQSVGDEVSIAIELTGMNSVEMDELVRLADSAGSSHDTIDSESGVSDYEMDERSEAGTAAKSRVAQGV